MSWWKLKPSKLNPWKVSLNKPARTFYGDDDNDGVMNMFDCEPHNKKKQGPEHLRHRGGLSYLKGKSAMEIIKEKKKKKKKSMKEQAYDDYLEAEYKGRREDIHTPFATKGISKYEEGD